MKKNNDQSSSSSIRRWLREIALGVFERIVGPVEKRSLRSVFAIAIVAMLITTSFPMVGKALLEFKRERDVHIMQDQVSKLEKLIKDKVLSKTLAKFDINYREIHYVDYKSDEKIISDIWENGQLNYRNYFQHGILIARDSFSYQNDKNNGKKREYFDNGAKVMIEGFSATGVLLDKRHCLKNDPGNCREYFREFRSPLPPAAYAFYR